MGGEGVAYHDIDGNTSRSGGSNKGPGYLNNVRSNEAVDISCTNQHDRIEHHEFNKGSQHLSKRFALFSTSSLPSLSSLNIHLERGRSGRLPVHLGYTQEFVPPGLAYLRSDESDAQWKLVLRPDNEIVLWNGMMSIL